MSGIFRYSLLTQSHLQDIPVKWGISVLLDRMRLLQSGNLPPGTPHRLLRIAARQLQFLLSSERRRSQILSVGQRRGSLPLLLFRRGFLSLLVVLLLLHQPEIRGAPSPLAVRRDRNLCVFGVLFWEWKSPFLVNALAASLTVASTPQATSHGCACFKPMGCTSRTRWPS